LLQNPTWQAFVIHIPYSPPSLLNTLCKITASLVILIILALELGIHSNNFKVNTQLLNAYQTSILV
jgi:hypothetical protein